MGSEWKEYTIGKIASLSYGKMPSEAMMNTGEYPTYSGYKYQHKYPEFNCEKGDVIVVARGVGGTGDVKLVREKCYLTNLSIKFNLKNEIVSNQYFYYSFLNQNLRHLDSGSAQSQITINDLSREHIVLPPLLTQNKIVQHLESIDNNITLNRELNQILEKMAQALFKSWFVDFDPVIDNALDAGNPIPESLQAKADLRQAVRASKDFTSLPDDIRNLFPSEFEESELGWIPKGWEVKALGDCYKVTMGQSPKGESYNKNKIGTLFFQGRAEFGWRYPTPKQFTTEPKRMAQAGDVLLSVRAPVGDINIALEGCCIGRGLSALKHHSNSTGYSYCHLSNLQNIFANFNGEGTVFGAINQKDLKNIAVIEPTYELTKVFMNNISDLDEAIRNKTLESNYLETLRDILLPKLISGEVKVG